MITIQLRDNEVWMLDHTKSQTEFMKMTPAMIYNLGTVLQETSMRLLIDPIDRNRDWVRSLEQ